MSPKIRVMVVDESAVKRQALVALFHSDSAIEVVGAVQELRFAHARMAQGWPDVIVLEVTEDRVLDMGGLQALLAQRPTPLVLSASHIEATALTSLASLTGGAVTWVSKSSQSMGELLSAVKNAAQCPKRSRTLASPHGGPKVVAIGISTGGVRALETVFRALSPTTTGIVVVQHMPENFTAAFSQRLNDTLAVEVLEAQGGERVVPGRVLVAPGGRHMKLNRVGLHYTVEVCDGPPVNGHRPSVDVLFQSVAEQAGANALGIIMTGMGNDGARGLKAMREAGAFTLGQDEGSCVVYGMPQEAKKLGAVAKEVPLSAIAQEIDRL